MTVKGYNAVGILLPTPRQNSIKVSILLSCIEFICVVWGRYIGKKLFLKLDCKDSDRQAYWYTNTPLKEVSFPPLLLLGVQFEYEKISIFIADCKKVVNKLISSDEQAGPDIFWISLCLKMDNFFSEMASTVQIDSGMGSYNPARNWPVSVMITGCPSISVGIAPWISSVNSCTNTEMHGVPSDDPTPVPTTPGKVSNFGVCSLRTIAISLFGIISHP